MIIPPSVAAMGPFERLALRVRQAFGYAATDAQISERDAYWARQDHEIKMSLEARRISRAWRTGAGL